MEYRTGRQNGKVSRLEVDIHRELDGQIDLSRAVVLFRHEDGSNVSLLPGTL